MEQGDNNIQNKEIITKAATQQTNQIKKRKQISSTKSSDSNIQQGHLLKRIATINNTKKSLSNEVKDKTIIDQHILNTTSATINTTSTITSTITNSITNINSSKPSHNWGKLVSLDRLESMSFDLKESEHYISIDSLMINLNGDNKQGNAIAKIYRTLAGATFINVLNGRRIFINGKGIGKKILISSLKSGNHVSFNKMDGKESMSFVFLDYTNPHVYRVRLNEISSNYIISKPLGEGATGEVSMGIDKSDGSQVAIKSVHKSMRSYFHKEKQLKREINILRQLDHINIASVIKVLRTDDQFSFSMQLANCGTLDQFAKRDLINEIQLKDVMLQIFNAVKYVHGKGIVHRDLKPANICCHLSDHDSKMNIIIVDFGFAIECKYKSRYSGSAIYTAPELIEYVSKEYGGGDCNDKIQYEPSSDIWSLGIIMFELFCGERPFRKVKNIKTGVFNFNNSKWSNITDGPKEIIKSILVKDPNTRISIDDILDHQ